MLNRIVGIAAIAAAAMGALIGCEANQINWGNHTYTVSGACIAMQPVTLHDGVGVGPAGYEVDFVKAYYGDLNHDGVQDAVVVLACTGSNRGGNQGATEIQIFSRDAKPIARLVQPDRYGSGNSFGSQFNLNSIGIHNNVLFTGAFGYLPGDPHCCASAYDVYRWDWNGHGFTPVDVETNQ